MPFKSQLSSLDDTPGYKKRGPKKVEGRKTTTLRLDESDHEQIAKMNYCLSKVNRMLIKKFLEAVSKNDSKKITLVINMPDDYLKN